MRPLQRILPLGIPTSHANLSASQPSLVSTLSHPQRSLATLPRRSPPLRARRSFHPSPAFSLPRRRDFFTANTYLQKSSNPNDGPEGSESGSVKQGASTPPKRKTRATGVKKSLRRVAIIAQQPPHRLSDAAPGQEGAEAPSSTMVMSAVCVAEGFNMASVPTLLKSHGYVVDPDGTGFEPGEVVHARPKNAETPGDVFVFPSGTLVTWSHPVEELTSLLLAAAEDAHSPERRETEDLEYITDPNRETSLVKGDVVVLGTRRENLYSDRLDTTLAKVAFSSGLARSTKLAVLESDLASYFHATKAIPSVLSQGSRLPLSRSFITQKTGELLSLSARLNNYSELTDSLPDIFWDSRSELGLEGYYDQVGRALDVNVRIKTLNQRLDYAQEIASVLREMSSERHGTRLEWIIILLIAVEVVFELRREWKEHHAQKELESLGT